MVESDNIHTQPIHSKEKALFDRIDKTLGEYATYLALDHQMAIEGAEWSVGHTSELPEIFSE